MEQDCTLGRGFFVTLELLAICRGLFNAAPDNEPTASLLPTPQDDESALRYRRRSHDFARRVPVHGGEDLLEDPTENLEGDDTRATLAALIDALTVPLPGTGGQLTFKRRMLYPFVGELIHTTLSTAPTGLAKDRAGVSQLIVTTTAAQAPHTASCGPTTTPLDSA